MNLSFARAALIVPFVLLVSVLLVACVGSPTPTLAPTTAPTIVATTALTKPAQTPAAVSTVAAAPTPREQLVVKASQNPKLGNILTDARGMTLYTFKNDKPDTSNCTGDCATTWPPLTVPQGVVPVTDPAVTGNIGVIERADKTYQVLYNDAPLYLYSGDKAPGDTNGNGLDNLWYAAMLVSPTPTPAATSATPAGTTATPPATP
jgi:predicted lipoprotein with Yx(FWY)xxD motif